MSYIDDISYYNTNTESLEGNLRDFSGSINRWQQFDICNNSGNIGVYTVGGIDLSRNKLNSYVFVNTKGIIQSTQSDYYSMNNKAIGFGEDPTDFCKNQTLRRNGKAFGLFKSNSECHILDVSRQKVLLKSYTLANLVPGFAEMDSIKLRVIIGYNGSFSVVVIDPITGDVDADGEHEIEAQGLSVQWGFDKSNKSNACAAAPDFKKIVEVPDYSTYCPQHWFQTADGIHCKATRRAHYDGRCGDSHMNMVKKNADDWDGRRRLESQCDLAWTRWWKRIKTGGTPDEWSKCGDMKLVLSNSGELFLYNANEKVGNYSIDQLPTIVDVDAVIDDLSLSNYFEGTTAPDVEKDSGVVYLRLVDDHNQPRQFQLKQRNSYWVRDDGAYSGPIRGGVNSDSAVVSSTDKKLGVIFEYNNAAKTVELNIYCVPNKVDDIGDKYAINYSNLGNLGYILSEPSGNTTDPSEPKFYDLNDPGRIPDDGLMDVGDSFISESYCKIDLERWEESGWLNKDVTESMECEKDCSSNKECIGYNIIDGSCIHYDIRNSEVDGAYKAFVTSIKGSDKSGDICGYKLPKIKSQTGSATSALPMSCNTHLYHPTDSNHPDQSIIENNIYNIDTTTWDNLYTKNVANWFKQLQRYGCGEEHYTKVKVNGVRNAYKTILGNLQKMSGNFNINSRPNFDASWDDVEPTYSNWTDNEHVKFTYNKINETVNRLVKSKYVSIFLLILLVVIIIIIILLLLL